MARIFITGSSSGLGFLAGEELLRQGHEVVLHARNAGKAAATRATTPTAQVVTGDVTTIAGARAVADAAAAHGPFDAVIHNVAMGYTERSRDPTEDGVPAVFATNTLAPYILTALLPRPARLVYMSSGMHRGAHAHLDDLDWTRRTWSGSSAYAETKLHDAMLAFAIARLWPDVLSNAVDPGWVPTRMGGRGAPDDLAEGYRTQAWLAVSNDTAARVTGRYFYHRQARPANPQASDTALQDQLLARCAELSGIALPK